MAPNTSNRDLIHVRFEFDEAMAARRDVLFSQIVSLRIEKAIKGYQFFRMKELDLKASLFRKMKDLRVLISKLEKTLPKLEIPEIIESRIHHEKSGFDSSEHIGAIDSESDIEKQLKEIQRRIDHLQRRGMEL